MISYHTTASPSPLWPEAFALAARAHAGQFQKDQSTPYIAHPCRVAMLVTRDFKCNDDAVIAAAVLHDVLEKTALTPEELRELVGEKVTEWVEWLSKGAMGPEADYWTLLASSPREAKLIKLADCLDHLGGHLDELDRRIESAKKALSIATDDDPYLAQARAKLSQAITRAEARKTSAESIGNLEHENDHSTGSVSRG